MDKQALIEGTKEPLRLLLIALVSWILTEGVLDTILKAFGIELTIEQRAMLFGFIAVVGRWADSVLHEVGKASGSDSLTRGLTRF